jgi:serine kinase of HPr protein (carbohydrate metabolism regulator)
VVAGYWIAGSSPAMTAILIHGTCVAWGDRAALLRGASGSGKSDLALRFLALPPEGSLGPRLVADDQMFVEACGDTLIASAPATLAGKIEVRGLGILAMEHLAAAELKLAVDLVPPADVPRMPPEIAQSLTLAGVALPVLRLAPFEASAPLKLKLALLSAPPQLPI